MQSEFRLSYVCPLTRWVGRHGASMVHWQSCRLEIDCVSLLFHGTKHPAPVGHALVDVTVSGGCHISDPSCRPGVDNSL